MRRERLQKIEEYITERGFARMEEIQREFEIAMPTVRKDISELASLGRIEKVYGGAKSITPAAESRELHKFRNRAGMHMAEKDAIARKAAELVEDGDVIYIDSGTTAASIIGYLEGKHVTVITSNLAAVNAITQTESVDAYLLGGRFNKETMAVDNSRALELFGEFNIDKAFMAATGYSIEGGIAQDSPMECEFKKHVLEISTDCYLTIDSSKIGKKALVRYANAEDIRNIITDGGIDREYRTFFFKNNINII